MIAVGKGQKNCEHDVLKMSAEAADGRMRNGWHADRSAVRDGPGRPASRPASRSASRCASRLGAGRPGVTRSPLRGRDSELAVIRERLSGALAGRAAVVVVEGRAGLGKTRLLAEAAAT